MSFRKRPFRKPLDLEKETQRIVRVVFIHRIEVDHVVRGEIRTYSLERRGCYRDAFPVNGVDDGEFSIPLLALAVKVKNEEDLFPVEAVIAFLSDDLVY